jgi:hypothetical protein
MKTDKGIYVDLIRARDGLKPLDVETDDTILVRMEHGNFKVRIHTPQPADVSVHLDGTLKLETKVAQGMSMIDRDKSGQPFSFTKRGDKPRASDTTSGDAQEPLFAEGTADNQKPIAETHGLVMVSVKFSEQPGQKPDHSEAVFFQMNAPQDHARTVAANLHRVIPPEGVTKSGCSCCGH